MTSIPLAVRHPCSCRRVFNSAAALPVISIIGSVPSPKAIMVAPEVPDALKAMQNVVLLPHIASASITTRNAMDQLVVDNLKLWFEGKAPMTPIAEPPVKGR